MPQMPHISSEYKNRRETVRSAVERAERFVLAEDYRGYDPYDALTSPVFRVIRSRPRIVRRGAQQVLRRLPVNVRPLLGIRKGRNPVTLGLGLQAWALLATAMPAERERYAAESARLVGQLRDVASPGWSGDCWGYDFDWETRDATVRAFTPTVVATGFVTNALFTSHERLGTDGALALCESACVFVTRDLHRTPGADGSFCWSYSPVDRGRVLNATAKGSRLLAQVGAEAGRPELFDDARRSLRFVVEHQRADGSWPYAIDDPRSWADNFHTAYVLDALAEYAQRTGDDAFAEATDAGGATTARTSSRTTGCRSLRHVAHPIDCTPVAQSMLTLCRFGTSRRRSASRSGHDDPPASRRRLLLSHRQAPHEPHPVHRWSTASMLLGSPPSSLRPVTRDPCVAGARPGRAKAL